MQFYQEEFNKVMHHMMTTTEYASNMWAVTEGSPWHREDNVLVHTLMVLEQYRLSIAKLNGAWTRQDYLGAIAALFHDVGKPVAMVKKFKEDRGDYFAFHGHELISARLWENFAVEYLLVRDMVTVEEIFTVGWMIEHHVPWAIVADAKRTQLAQTARYVGKDMFINVLMADQRGRISDGQDLKLRDVDTWLSEFNKLFDSLNPATILDSTAPTLYVPIAPSGSGKSTFRKCLPDDIEYFSLDALRHEFYNETDYRIAWEKAADDSTFMGRANAVYQSKVKLKRDLYVDNVNLSKKKRTFYVDSAKRLGYNTVAVLFPITLQTVIYRQKTRGDKWVPEGSVRNQYMNLQYPFIGEFDSIIVCDPYVDLS